MDANDDLKSDNDASTACPSPMESKFKIKAAVAPPGRPRTKVAEARRRQAVVLSKLKKEISGDVQTISVHRAAQTLKTHDLSVTTGIIDSIPVRAETCNRWWLIEHVDEETTGICLPGYIVPTNSCAFSPWFPIEQAVPNNVVFVSSTIARENRVGSTNKRYCTNVPIEFICVLNRFNMIPDSPISTSIPFE
ncbi:unnamed protein product (mitochondrion) [Plasmodiophora brassicae]|uniref:Uncharacterized protein n=1 Tax=Plasmodiophora brassicae TaxID=37360 RepID=A0A3P3Y8A6_PLABS|nr:unnamed protein product [Plasmodiophora brassicae]